MMMLLRVVLVTAVMGAAMSQQERMPVGSVLRKTLRPGGRNRGGQKVCNAACPRIYLPVCGSDGKTYPNSCALEYYTCVHGNVTYAYQGVCEDQEQCPTVCPRVMEPVCGSDGRTYSNECRLRMASCTGRTITKVTNAPCWVASVSRPACPPTCRGTYEPVCGSDGNTYGNKCTLDLVSCRDASITLARRGACGVAFNTCPAVCPEVEEPVCGSDGVTYKNECVFKATTCTDTTTTITTTAGECASPPQRPCPVLCPTEYKPVCGTDGKTYSNKCVLESQACYTHTLALASTGECNSSSSDQVPSSKPSIPTRAFIPQRPITTTTTTTTTTRPPTIFTLMPSRLFCPNNCGRVFNPVCASDGRTYYNRCLMNLIGCRERRTLFVTYSGRCVVGFIVQ